MSHLELPVSGMTCASCAARGERTLNGLDGVSATVNYATERATVDFDEAAVAPEQLVDAVESAGYGASLPGAPRRDAGEARGLRIRWRISTLLAVPVVALSMIGPLQFAGWELVALCLATPVVLWGAWPFHREAWRGLRHRTATMDTLISIGTLAAWMWSVAAVVTDAEDLYLEVASVVTVLVLAGRLLESRARGRAGSALEALLRTGARDAAVLGPDGTERRVPVEELRAGDRFVVRPGERVATDGVVEDGSSAVDASILTGESRPVEKHPGDDVAGGSVNAGGRLVVRATRVGADTALAQIARLVADAQSGKARVQRLADRVSAVFVPAVGALALATLAGWLVAGQDTADAISAAVAVLIIACPCALGLATPTALMVGTARGAQLGLLIKGPEVLESTRGVDTVLLDKTGTVTTGRMSLVEVVAEDRGEALRLCGALEDASEHPVGRAIARAARAEFGLLPAVHDFAATPGAGVAGGRRRGPRGGAGRGRGGRRRGAPRRRRPWSPPRRAGAAPSGERAAGGRAARRDRRPRRLGRRGPRRARRRRHRQAGIRGRRRRAPRARAAAGAAHRGQPRDRGGRRRRRRHRRGGRRGPARRQGGRGVAAAGAGSRGRRRGRRRQRRPRARPGRPRAGGRLGRRRRDRGLRPHDGLRRPARRPGRDPPVARDPADDPPEPRLGLRLQRRGAAAGGGRRPEPRDRRRRDGPVERVGRRQRAAPASVPLLLAVPGSNHRDGAMHDGPAAAQDPCLRPLSEE